MLDLSTVLQSLIVLASALSGVVVTDYFQRRRESASRRRRLLSATTYLAMRAFHVAQSTMALIKSLNWASLGFAENVSSWAYGLRGIVTIDTADVDTLLREYMLDAPEPILTDMLEFLNSIRFHNLIANSYHTNFDWFVEQKKSKARLATRALSLWERERTLEVQMLALLCEKYLMMVNRLTGYGITNVYERVFDDTYLSKVDQYNINRARLTEKKS